MYCIYLATNSVNGKKYVGKTNNFLSRKYQHESGKENHLFSRAIQKYGKDAFSWVIIESGIPTNEQANVREQFWIAQYHTFFKDKNSNGYNMTRGGDGGYGQNARAVAAYTKDGKYLCSFCTVTEAAKVLNISGSTSISRACDTETPCKGIRFRYIDNNNVYPTNIGIYHRPKSKRGKRVCQLDKDGKLLKTYDSIKAVEIDGFDRVHVTGCAKGYCKTTGGSQWCYESDLPSHENVPLSAREAYKTDGSRIFQYTVNNEFVAMYVNCAEAARKAGIPSYKVIHKALRSKTHYSSGFLWYKKQYANPEVTDGQQLSAL